MDAGTSNDRAGRHELAELIRNATAWWRLAADELEAGRDERAAGYAYLGRFGLDGAGDRLEVVTGPACTCGPDAEQPAGHCRRHAEAGAR